MHLMYYTGEDGKRVYTLKVGIVALWWRHMGLWQQSHCNCNR